MAAYRTSIRFPANTYTNSAGSGATAITVSLTNTTAMARDTFITGVAVGGVAAAANNTNAQLIEVRAGSTVVFRKVVGVAGSYATFIPFYSPIHVRYPTQCSATVSVSAAGQTADVTLLYYLEPSY